MTGRTMKIVYVLLNAGLQFLKAFISLVPFFLGQVLEAQFEPFPVV